MSGDSVGLETIRGTAEVLRGQIEPTLCHQSQTLTELMGADVFLKFENLQFTASFKERGALTKLLSLGPAERESGVVCMSAGNHALGVAHHAQRLGIPATIVMPRLTPNVKVENTLVLGAEVILSGDDLEAASAHALELARERGLCFIHPYDDEAIIRGQGTVALEMLEQLPELDTLLVPVGGGGLISGCALAANELGHDVELIGVQSERFPALRQTLLGESVSCGGATIAEGIAVQRPGELTLPIVRDRVSEILLVGEADLEQAVLLLLEIEKTVVEGAGAAGLAAMLAHRERFAGRRVGLILSGGNIDLLVLSSIIRRGLVHTSRLVRLSVEVPDTPGSLAGITACIGRAGANIIEIDHHRAFTSAPLKSAEVEFVLEARGPEHVEQISAALMQAGYVVRVG